MPERVRDLFRRKIGKEKTFPHSWIRRTGANPKTDAVHKSRLKKDLRAGGNTMTKMVGYFLDPRDQPRPAKLRDGTRQDSIFRLFKESTALSPEQVAEKADMEEGQVYVEVCGLKKKGARIGRLWFNKIGVRRCSRD